jgi:hypothetical protein
LQIEGAYLIANSLSKKKKKKKKKEEEKNCKWLILNLKRRKINK